MGSETRLTPRETAQACNIRYQGGPGCRSYASIPRGLRCEPWSGRAEDIGMNGDQSAPCRCCLSPANLWKKLIVWAACVRDVHRTLDRLRVPAGGSGGPALAMKSPWERAQGLLVSCALRDSGLIFGQSIVDERCGSEGTRCVLRVVHNGKGSRTRPGGRLVRRSLIAYRPAMRLARVAKKK